MCRLWLGLKAPALAWLELALAFQNLELGQKPKNRAWLGLALAQAGAFGICMEILMLSLTQLEMCSRRTVTKVLIKIETQPDIPEVHKRIRPLALAFRNAGPGQKPSQAKPQVLAWPGLFWLGLAGFWLQAGAGTSLLRTTSTNGFVLKNLFLHLYYFLLLASITNLMRSQPQITLK
ncbi:hypothetical protein CPB84DRAFT_1754123 [Gymnopilus junonius]|uniref:Uncharacterized protein n=1 Tax=Gymnopilus junonius TaxID=109634 RepID=A0A9P5N816_GYMJU|nr:hypothetical protein CPB84DRAFT_1754123 [Gymnopilus junonius]